MQILPKDRRLPNGTVSMPRNVRITADEMVEIKQYAANEKKSHTWFLRVMVLRGLEGYKRELAYHQSL